jgi:peroxiredoxin
VINHEQTLARLITRSIVITDDSTAGQIIYKQPTE